MSVPIGTLIANQRNLAHHAAISSLASEVRELIIASKKLTTYKDASHPVGACVCKSCERFRLSLSAPGLSKYMKENQ